MIFIGNMPLPDSPPLPLELHPSSVIRNRMMEVRLRRDSVSSLARRQRRWGHRLRRVATGNCGGNQADRADQRLAEWVHQNFCQRNSLAIVCLRNLLPLCLCPVALHSCLLITTGSSVSASFQGANAGYNPAGGAIFQWLAPQRGHRRFGVCRKEKNSRCFRRLW